MSKSPSLRRIQADVRELALDPSDRYHAAPLEDDMFEWHFTIRGAEGTDFEGGIYHGRILLPPEYPFKPPHIMFLTPSGRFETGTKVCLSFSAYHPELWQPAWGIRLILEALISFLPTPADGAIGALDWTPQERKRLAQKSVSYCCPRCGNTAALLPEPKEGGAKGSKSRFAKEIEQLQMLQAENESKNNNKKNSDDAKEEPKPKEEEEQAAPLVEENSAAAAVPAPPAAATTTTETANAAAEPKTSGDATPAAAPEQQTPTTQVTETPAGVEVQVDEFADAVEPEPTPAVVDWSWCTDRLVHNCVAIMSLLLYLLWRKGCALYTEIQEINAQLQVPIV